MKLKFCLLVSLLTSAANSADPESDYAIVKGRIDEQMLSEVSKNIKKIHTVVITSQGGDTSAAMDLGTLLHDNKIKIRVEKYCLSACAQYILPSAASLEFIDMPIVGVHQSPIAVVEFHRFQAANVDAFDIELAMKERSFFKRLNLKPDVSTQPVHYMELMCYGKRDGRPTIGSKWTFFVPSLATYKKWVGKDFLGAFASKKLDVINSVRRHIPKGVSMALITEDEATWRPFKPVSPCP